MKMHGFSIVMPLVCLALSIGCNQDFDPPMGTSRGSDLIAPQEVQEVIDNLIQISDYALQGQVTSAPPTRIYIRGKADGSIETETRTTLKGVLQLIIRQTRGLKDKATLTQTKIFDSDNDFKKNLSALERNLKIMGATGGQILTILHRNTTQEIQTFHPVVISVRPDFTTERRGLDDGSIQVVRKKTLTSEVRSITTIYGIEDGSIITRQTYPDGSWEQVQVKGNADTTIFRIYTRGNP